MIVNGRLTAYLHSLDTGNGALCGAIEKEAIKARVPILKRETAALLKTMVLLKRPERILEVGTAVGYSALIMAQVMPATAHITTIEKYEKRIPEAKKNFSRAGMEQRITLLEGDAGELLAGLSGSFDFIFMDPPYDRGLERKVLEYLSDSRLVYEDTVIIVEASRDTDFSYVDDLGLTVIREKVYKTNKHVFIEKAGKEEIC